MSIEGDKAARAEPLDSDKATKALWQWHSEAEERITASDAKIELLIKMQADLMKRNAELAGRLVQANERTKELARRFLESWVIATDHIVHIVEVMEDRGVNASEIYDQEDTNKTSMLSAFAIAWYEDLRCVMDCEESE